MVIINSENGSRTIIHSNKNLPDLTVEDFKKLDLSCYSWIHFEVKILSWLMVTFLKLLRNCQIKANCTHERKNSSPPWLEVIKQSLNEYCSKICSQLNTWKQFLCSFFYYFEFLISFVSLLTCPAVPVMKKNCFFCSVWIFQG